MCTRFSQWLPDFEDEEPLYAAGDPAFQPQFFQPDNIPAFNPLVHAAQANRITPRFPQRPSCNFYAKEAASEDENFESFGLTVNQIKFRRRYYFAQRERKHAVAIVHPETKEVLLPGKAKITEEEEENQRQNALEAERLNQIFYEKQRLLKEALDCKSLS